MAAGFYWTANSPYIQGMWIRARRAPRAPAISTTVADGFINTTDSTGRVYRNANPAYMIYECLTNSDWGMGDDPATVDTASFASAAAVLKTEGFGLFMLWVQSDTIENFVGEILDHIQAFLFLSPKTGKWTLKLLRADYVVANLPVYDPDNADITDFDRKVWGETINEIVVSWTNPVTEQVETVTEQDLANIVQQNGQIVSQSRNYYGIRSGDLAVTVAARDLRTACAPLATCSLKCFRSAWGTTPGDCVVVNWPSENADHIVMRVMGVDYGDRSDSAVTVTLIEDIFALDAPAYTASASSAQQPTAAQPNAPGHVKLFTLPAFLVAATGLGLNDPEVIAGLLVSDPNLDFRNYEPYTAVALPNGTVQQQSIGTRAHVGYVAYGTALPRQAVTTIASFGAVEGLVPTLANLVFIGAGGDVDVEIAIIQAIATDGTYTLYRGVLDTVPRAWPAGTPMWFLRGDVNVVDTTRRAPGETVKYRPLMRTSVALLPYDSGVDASLTLTDRPYLPTRPANVQVNGVGFGTATLGGGNATVTWANRNRLSETSQILAWTAADVTPEMGQTTTVRVLDSGGGVLKTFAGLTGTTTTVLAADLVGGAAIKVSAVTTEGESLQSYVLPYTA